MDRIAAEQLIDMLDDEDVAINIDLCSDDDFDSSDVNDSAMDDYDEDDVEMSRGPAGQYDDDDNNIFDGLAESSDDDDIRTRASSVLRRGMTEAC